LGHGFCNAGHEVSLIDKPARIAALRSAGELFVIGEDGTVSAASSFHVSSDYSELCTHHIILFATKAQDFPAASIGIDKLADSNSTFVTIQNRIP